MIEERHITGLRCAMCDGHIMDWDLEYADGGPIHSSCATGFDMSRYIQSKEDM